MNFSDLSLVAAVVGAAVIGIEISMRIAALGIIPGNRKPSTGMLRRASLGTLSRDRPPGGCDSA